MLTMIDGPELTSNSRRHDRYSGRRPVEQVRLSVEYILIYLERAHVVLKIAGEQALDHAP